MESRFGKADLIVVDPQLVSVARKSRRDAQRMGQPIPVVIYDYIHDSAARGEKLDIDDPKYKYQPTLASDGVPAIRALNGRNAFTESDREAIVAYFIDKPESSWSLNAAAKELASSIPTHTQKSFQTYLQDNFEKGWSLKQKVLQARRAALEAEPSELQARILRSQYTASPSLAEQSNPSDDWPRASPAPPSHGSIAQRTINNTQTEAAEKGAGGASVREDHEEDLQVRHPNPGDTIENVERSPTKANKPVVAYASSQASSPGTSPQPSDASHDSIEISPRQQVNVPTSPSVREESDPEEFSPRIMSELRRLESPLSKPSQRNKRLDRRIDRSDDSDNESEIDQLDADRIDSPTTGQAEDEAEGGQHRADDIDDPEWHGTRSADKTLREKDTSRIKEVRVKFTQGDKDDLVDKLVGYVVQRGLISNTSEQDAILAKPDDAFWERVAADNPSHSAMSWRSHYLKNRPTYKQIIRYKLAEFEDAGDDDDDDDHDEDEEDEEDDEDDEDDDDDDDDDDEGQVGEDIEAAQEQTKSEHSHLHGARRPSDKHAKAAKPSDPTAQRDIPAQIHEMQDESSLAGLRPADDANIPDDGVVVLIPTEPVGSHQLPKRPRTPTRGTNHGRQTLSTPPIEEDYEEDDLLQDNYGITQVRSHGEHASTSSGEDSFGSAKDLDIFKADNSVHGTDSIKEMEDNARVNTAEARTSFRSASRAASTTWPTVQQGQSHIVDAGTPVLAQHREAPFYDFSIDSDEEKRIRRKIRSRPSLPTLKLKQAEASVASHRYPITTERVLGHFATPSRNQRDATRGQDERIQRTREWARSVSASPPSARSNPPQGFQPIAMNESSRSRASRIDRRLLPADVHASEMYPTRLQQDFAQDVGHIPGRGSSTIQNTTGLAVARTRAQQPHAAEKQARRPSLSGEEAARLHYRAEVERFRSNFGLNKEQLRELLVPFHASVKHARNHLESWLLDMEGTYGVDAEVALEYVKTSRGDFEQAETYLKLAAMTRSSSMQDQLSGAPSRSVSHSLSPVKRSARSDERSFDHTDRNSGRGGSSKRYRR